MAGSQITLIDRPDLGTALEHVDSPRIVRTAAVTVVEGLGADETVLGAVVTKTSGVDGAVFVTSQRILVTANRRDPSRSKLPELGNLASVIILSYRGGWAIVARPYSAYKVWSGFTEEAAKRM